jgi:hypothetical protein
MPGDLLSRYAPSGGGWLAGGRRHG